MKMDHDSGTLKRYDLVIVGGSLGGTAAAYSAAKMGMRVALIEESEWIGGQLTNQAVPPDEHQWIETFGATKSYRQFRERIRAYYRRNYPLNEEAMAVPDLNPGNAWVSRLAHEPRVAWMVLSEMLSPYQSNGRITLYLEHRMESVDVQTDWIRRITARSIRGKKLTLFESAFFLDATELGDLIDQAGVEHHLGAEPRTKTGEAHAAPEEEAADLQPGTWVAAVEFVPGGSAPVEKPYMYEMWKRFSPPYQDVPQLSWYGAGKNREDRRRFTMFPDPKRGSLGLFPYRRIIDHTLFQAGFYRGDLSLLNWPQNDYLLGSFMHTDGQSDRDHREAARQLTLSLVYWLQNEAERDEGGVGYPEIGLRGDAVGTEDGLALSPYIRESRRIEAMVTIREAHVVRKHRWEDSVGIGHYAIDLHPTLRTYTHLYLPTAPFEIPLGGMIPKRVRNMVPANSKLIGTTHITNGCFRVHPIEWNVGEVAGYLIAYCLSRGITPFETWKSDERRREFQELLIDEGIALHWPDDFSI